MKGYILIQDSLDGERFIPVNGTLFYMEEFNIECLLHKSKFSSFNYTVTCAQTGTYLGYGDTPREAKDDANRNLIEFCKTHDLKQVINDWVEKHGKSPIKAGGI